MLCTKPEKRASVKYGKTQITSERPTDTLNVLTRSDNEGVETPWNI